MTHRRRSASAKKKEGVEGAESARNERTAAGTLLTAEFGVEQKTDVGDEGDEQDGRSQ